MRKSSQQSRLRYRGAVQRVVRRPRSLFVALALLSSSAAVALPTAGATAAAASTGAAAAPVGTPVPVSAPAAVGTDGELLNLRTRNSSSYELASNSPDNPLGSVRTISSLTPRNYRDGLGNWQKIDDRLVPDGSGGYQLAADDWTLSLPSSLSKPVTAGKGPGSLTVGLRGGAGNLSVKGVQATYTDALPGVDVLLNAVPDELKESVRLNNASTATSFTYDLNLPSGLVPTLTSAGGVDISRSGQVLMTLPKPVMDDASGNPDTGHSDAVSYSLAKSGAGWALTLTADPTWLHAAGRPFPVVIDPTTTFAGATSNDSCTLADGSYANNSYCDGSNPAEVDHLAHVRRALLKFGDLSAIPHDAFVGQARLSLQNTGTAGNALLLDLYGVTRNWTTAATWNKFDGTTSWTTAGGDLDGAQSDSEPGPTSPTTTTWYPTNTAKAWISGTRANYGVLLKQRDETVAGNDYTFANFSSVDGNGNPNGPTLAIDWSPQIGQPSWLQTYDQRLSDRIDLHVNLANHNLVVNNTDDTLPGPGQSLVVRRTYNSRDGLNYESGNDIGRNWRLSIGADTWLDVNTTDVIYNEPGGGRSRFTRLGGGSTYAGGAGLNATLTSSDQATFTLKFNKTGITRTFFRRTGDTRAVLTQVKDRNGNIQTFNYSSSGTSANGLPWLDSMTDTAGRTLTTSHSTYIDSISESGSSFNGQGRTFGYKYSNGNLSEYDDPAGGVTKYAYDSSNRLTSITTPRGNVTAFAYDADSGITAITYVSNPTAPAALWTGPTTTFSYSGQPVDNSTNGQTTVTTMGHATKYNYDVNDRIVRSVDPNNQIRSATYTANNDVSDSYSAVNSANGSKPTHTDYDANNNATGQKLPTGAQVTSQYPGDSGATCTQSGGDSYSDMCDKDAQGNVTSYSYDANGNRTSATQGSNKSKAIYEGDTDPDFSGVTAHCGPNGTAAQKGLVCEARDPAYSKGSATTPTAVTAHRTLYSYDAAGNLVKTTPASPLAATTATFDPFGRVASSTDGNGKTTTFTYDALDRVTKATYADGTATAYVYDNDSTRPNGAGTAGGDGDLSAQQELAAGGSVTREVDYTYDTRNRHLGQHIPAGAVAGEGDVSYAWDDASNMTSYTDQGGTVSYGYDPANQLVSVTEPGGSCSGYSLNTAASYPPAGSGCILLNLDPDGHPTTTYFGGGNRQDTGYDNSGRVAVISGTKAGTATTSPMYKYTNSYLSGSGGTDGTQLTKKADSGTDASPHTNAYSYDSHNQVIRDLVTSTSSGSTLADRRYCYDADGNLTGLYTNTSLTCSSTSGFTYTAAFGGADQQTSVTGGGTAGGSFSYDNQGNELTAPSVVSRTSGYNVRNQATSIAGTSQTYQASDNRSRLSSGGTTFANTDLGLSSFTTGSTTTYVTRTPGGQPLTLRVGSSSSYVDHDLLADYAGSISRMVSPTGTVEGSYSYDPYGQITIATSTVPNPLLYNGGYYDSTTKLYKYGYRYYDPTLGHFTQTDPVGDPKQISHYAYAGSNPVNNADPSGALGANGSGDGTTPQSYYSGDDHHASCYTYDECHGFQNPEGCIKSVAGTAFGGLGIFASAIGEGPSGGLDTFLTVGAYAFLASSYDGIAENC